MLNLLHFAHYKPLDKGVGGEASSSPQNGQCVKFSGKKSDIKIMLSCYHDRVIMLS
jgi:hypothetical protein